MRSKLFVPGSRPELFPKALASQADALSFDLEDAVAENRKDEARAQLQTLLRSELLLASDKTIIVRVNAIGTTHFAADVAAVALAGLSLINLPKAERPEDVVAAVQAIEQAERANGVTRPIRLLLNIESPAGLRRAHELAQAHPRVAGLQLGLADLFEPVGIARRENAAVVQAMFQLRMAAGHAPGVFAFDSVFADIKDEAGFRAEAQLARNLGFLGKSVIHPSQVALANEAFRPSDAEIAHAIKVVEAAGAAREKGVGAYVVDGKMIDGPFELRAHAILATARKLGLTA
jgi:citrate lyase subunit beta/citryl-CoA lyase